MISDISINPYQWDNSFGNCWVDGLKRNMHKKEYGIWYTITGKNNIICVHSTYFLRTELAYEIKKGGVLQSGSYLVEDDSYMYEFTIDRSYFAS